MIRKIVSATVYKWKRIINQSMTSDPLNPQPVDHKIFNCSYGNGTLRIRETADVQDARRITK